MPARRLILHALLGPALAGVPAALAFAPGLPPGAPGAGPITPAPLEAGTPGSDQSTRNVALAGGEGHAVAAVGAADGRPTRLVELRPGQSARLIRTFPRGATNPTVGTDAEGRVVVLVRTCAARTQAGKGADCGIETVDLISGDAKALPGTAGADIAAMDRGAIVTAKGAQLTLTAASPAPRTPGRPTPLPQATAKRLDTTVVRVEDLDLRDGVVAATFELGAAFGGSQLARFDPLRGWTILGVSTDGGAAIGHRGYYAPTVTTTGVRAFYDGAEDLPGYAARWATGTTPGRIIPKPAREVRAAKLGNPLFLRSAAFLGDRLVVFTGDDSCDLDDCELASAGPFPLG